MISIILPIRNEELYIEKCLNTILTQNFPLNKVEVLIADGMSTDNTRSIVRDYSLEHPILEIYIIDNHHKIVSSGMNKALRQAKGDIIIRVDGHCLIAPDYITNCVNHLQNEEVDGVGGPMKSIGETALAETIAIGMSSPFGVGNSTFRTTTGITKLVDTVPFPAYTRKIIEKVGLYDEELVRNQDDEYNFRIREQGGKILLAEDVKSTYFSRGSLGDIWKQYYQYGFWKVRVLQKHPRQMSLRQFAPPVFVMTLLISAILAIFPTTRLFSLFIPILYLITNIGASIITSMKKGWKHLPLLPIVFAILHLSYGSGFLIGLIKFVNRWGDKKGKVPDFDFNSVRSNNAK